MQSNFHERLRYGRDKLARSFARLMKLCVDFSRVVRPPNSAISYLDDPLPPSIRELIRGAALQLTYESWSCRIRGTDLVAHHHANPRRWTLRRLVCSRTRL